MVKKNPRFRHRFSFSESPEKKSEGPITRDDIVNSLTRQSQTPEHVLELKETATEETAQPVEPYESVGAVRHGRSKLWIAPLTIIGASAALYFSGLLPASVVNTGDIGLDYLTGKATSLGPILWGEIATIGLVIIVLGRHMRHRSSSHTADKAQ